MTDFPIDRLIFGPGDVDLSRSPLRGAFEPETFVLGAFNPGLTRLPNGNLLLMVRIAEALREPVANGHIHAIRWRQDGRYVLDAWPVEKALTADPRSFILPSQGGAAMALTSISWLLPVELSPDGLDVLAVHYDRAVEPARSYQVYGVEDPRISRIGDRWYMTTCSVSAERLCTALYISDNALDWRLDGVVLDHQNKDMLYFEGLVAGQFMALTRPQGNVFFAYPPDSICLPGPSINLARSPDGRHWRPLEQPGIRPRAGFMAIERIGGGTPPILTDDGWLTLYHGVEPRGVVGIYRTYWALLDRDDPSVIVHQADVVPLMIANPALTAPIRDRMYLDDVVFTTGIVDGGDHYIIASGEADLACRITHVPKSAFRF